MSRKLLLSLLLSAGLQLPAQTFHFQLFDVPNSASTEADNINATGSGTISTQFDLCAGTATGTYTGTISQPNSK